MMIVAVSKIGLKLRPWVGTTCCRNKVWSRVYFIPAYCLVLSKWQTSV